MVTDGRPRGPCLLLQHSFLDEVWNTISIDKMTSVDSTAKLTPPGSKSPMKTECNAGEKDVFREIPLRYTGYANEVGEAFRNMVAMRFVYLSYAISSGYVVSHAIAQGVSKRRKLNRIETGSTIDRIKTNHTNLLINSSSTTLHHNFSSLSTGNQKHTVLSQAVNRSQASPTTAVLDTLVWQGLASVMIPGLAINRLCAGSRLLLNRYATRVLSQQVRRWAVTGIGLASIPMIIHPIDWAVDKFMDSLIRPHFH